MSAKKIARRTPEQQAAIDAAVAKHIREHDAEIDAAIAERTPEQRAAIKAAIDRACRDAEDGPSANPSRAREIALMDGFGLEEFVELTGVGVGDYGIYCISSEGVSVPSQKDLATLTAKAQHGVHNFARRASLGFPCTPEEFMQWYDATRGGEPHPKGRPGDPCVSDFPLAEGFAKELRRHGPSSAASAEPSVTSDDIIAAFRVKPDARANEDWWKLRQRDAKRNGLEPARAATGAAKRRSRWYRSRVAGWLIDKRHLELEAVHRAMRAREWDADLL